MDYGKTWVIAVILLIIATGCNKGQEADITVEEDYIAKAISEKNVSACQATKARRKSAITGLLLVRAMHHTAAYRFKR